MTPDLSYDWEGENRRANIINGMGIYIMYIYYIHNAMRVVYRYWYTACTDMRSMCASASALMWL